MQQKYQKVSQWYISVMWFPRIWECHWVNASIHGLLTWANSTAPERLSLHEPGNESALDAGGFLSCLYRYIVFFVIVHLADYTVKNDCVKNGSRKEEKKKNFTSSYLTCSVTNKHLCHSIHSFSSYSIESMNVWNDHFTAGCFFHVATVSPWWYHMC